MGRLFITIQNLNNEAIFYVESAHRNKNDLFYVTISEGSRVPIIQNSESFGGNCCPGAILEIIGYTFSEKSEKEGLVLHHHF